RFGMLHINPNNAISFPYGIAGIPNINNYCIAHLTPEYEQKLPNFKILQATHDENIAFIVLPQNINNNLLTPSDLLDACEIQAIQPENLLLLFIASIHKNINAEKRNQLSINVKAPIFVDIHSKIASQYIFLSDEYDVRHIIE
ncbi:MAG: flagellar assembly protein FliW, partial [Pseudomonadota bacterium]